MIKTKNHISYVLKKSVKTAFFAIMMILCGFAIGYSVKPKVTTQDVIDYIAVTTCEIEGC